MYFYISFATDKGFRGATVVKAKDAAHALAVATKRNLNPGGEAAILEVPPEAEGEPDMRAMINRLVGRDEMLAMGGKRKGDLDPEIQAKFDAASEKVCEDCNTKF